VGRYLFLFAKRKRTPQKVSERSLESGLAAGADQLADLADLLGMGDLLELLGPLGCHSQEDGLGQRVVDRHDPLDCLGAERLRLGSLQQLGRRKDADERSREVRDLEENLLFLGCRLLKERGELLVTLLDEVPVARVLESQH
jgi:hypothetical protein